MQTASQQPPMRQKKLAAAVSGLQNSYAAWARVIGRTFGLNVVFGGHPATDGETMWLPCLPYDLNADDLKIVRSHILHEAAHLKFTNFIGFKNFGIKHGMFAQFILNTIEDARIERQIALVYGGAKALLESSSLLMIRKGKCRTGKDSHSDALGMLCYLTGCLVNGWNSPEIKQARDDAEAYLIQHLGTGSESLTKQVRELVEAELPLLSSTSDAEALTQKVLDLFNFDDEEGDSNENSESGEDKGEEAGEQSESSNSGDDNEGQGAGNGNPDPSISDSGDQGGQSGESRSDQSQDKQTSKSKDASSENGDGSNDGESSESGQDGQGASQEMKDNVSEMLNSEPEGEVIDFGQSIEQLDQDIKQGKRPEYKGAPCVPESGQSRPAGGASWHDPKGITYTRSNEDVYKLIERGVGRRAGTLLGQLQALLQTEVDEEIQYSNRGRIISKRLWRAGMDDDQIFGRVTQEEQAKAAVSVLSDLSGSMDGPRIELAMQALILLEKAMSMVGNPTEYLGFGDKAHHALTVAKSFNDSSIAARGKIGGLRELVGGGTPLLEALFEAGLRLTSREESKKLMFILTDGDPCKESECAEVSRRMEGSGVHVVYFLIGMNAIPEWLQGLNAVCIPNVNALSTQVLKQIRKYMI